MLTTSFVIPVRNDAVRLDRCIRSIQRNGQPGAPPEVVVVDNGSIDDSAATARGLGARVLSIEGGSVAELRNAGAAVAFGALLAFVDADHEIGNGWIAAAHRVLEASDVAAVGALYHPPPGGTWVQRAYGLLRGVARGVHDVEWLGSGNLAVRREVFASIGGFDTSLTTCEDVDLCNRIRATGYRIVSSAEMTTVHYGDPDTLWGLFKGELWRGRDNLRVTFRGPLTWRALPSACIPVIDLAATASALAGLVIAAAGFPRGWIAAATSCAVIAAFATVRAARALGRADWPGVVPALQATIAALVYDLARACALVAHAPHRGGQAQTGAAR